jgi:AcrR family transcriptional regulator
VTQRRVRLLDSDKIVDTAMRLIAEHGRFTMPELAQRLGVSVSSIYHHVPGRAALIEAIRERVEAPARVGELDESDWAGSVTSWLAGRREAFAGHPELLPLLAGPESGTPLVFSGHDALAGVLDSAGFPDEQARRWLGVLDAFGVGSALALAAELARRDHPPPDRREVDEAFEAGARAIVDGMRADLASAN